MRGRIGSQRTVDRLVPDGFCACPVDVAFSVVGKKWTIHILRNMLRGHSHFNQFLQNIDGLNPKTLSARLKELEREKLVLKRVQTTPPLTIVYALTEKGHAVLPILRQMVQWTIEWAPERIFANGKLPKALDRCIEEWQAHLVASNGDLAVPAVRPRPRARVKAV